MSDNLRRYRAIRDALIQCYPGQPSGTVARHLITLAALISGIVGSKVSHIPRGDRRHLPPLLPSLPLAEYFLHILRR